MIKYLKINFIYFFSKKNIICLSLCLIFTVGMNIFITMSNLNLNISSFEQQNYTWETIYSFSKIINIILSCFLMNNFIISINDNYKVLFIINLKKRNIYYISKIITLLITIFSFVFLSFFIYVLVNLLCNKNYSLKIEYIKGFLSILFISFVFGIISLIITKILDNSICVVIPIVIYICSEFFEIRGKIINTFFPNYSLDVIEKAFMFSATHYFVLSAFYIILFLCIIKD